MTVALNMKSARIQKRIVSLIMDGVDASLAVKQVRAEALAEIAEKSARLAARAATFESLREEGLEQQVPEDVVNFVRDQFKQRAFDRANGIKPALYSSYAAMRCAQAWNKAQWNPALCYAEEKTIQKIIESM